MNKQILLSFLFAALIAYAALGQAPNFFSYQAVVRNPSGNVVASQSVGLRLTVLNLGAPVFTETFTTQTNAYGMLNVNLGSGTATLGNFQTVNWLEGNSKSMKVEMDITGGTAYVDFGTTGFTSVPYALVANSVKDVKLNDLTDVNTTNATANQVLQWNGSEWTPATISTAPAIVTTSALSGTGTSSNPLTIAQQSAINGQVLQWNGSSWLPATVSGGVGDNWGTQFVQKNVTLNGNGTAASPLGIAQQGALAGESLIWNGSLWTPGRPSISVDGVFSGNGAGLPLKLSQQGAANGDALTWNGTTWIPRAPFSLPYIGSGTGAAGFGAFTISNPATNGPSVNAVEGVANGGVGVYGSSNPASGKGVEGRSSDGIGVYGSSTNGLAAAFDGTVAVFGQLKVFGSQVLRANDLYFFDQTSNLQVTNNTATSIPGLDAMNFTVNNTASVATPAKVVLTFNAPSLSTSSNAAKEVYQVQLLIKNGSTLVKQVNCSDYLASLSVKSFSYTLHTLISNPGTYTASAQLFKADGTAVKDVSVGAGQVQIQVVHQ
ncbi:MAG: hypothetical protein DI539_18550 [Flavobacterium psychrophilum]|jgi:hypothetical protein|nr:MAG: hypothetical protein DI539_18550 [Flavobacterium psychrophilum]